jgi:hypothetical protein
VRDEQVHGEWDSRILSTAPGERFEMPNISRTLVESAMEAANWDSPRAIADLFKIMGEPEAGKMPGLALELSQALHSSKSDRCQNRCCLR